MVWTEARGFDSIWLTEHHFIDYGLSVSPGGPGGGRRDADAARAHRARGCDPSVPRSDSARRGARDRRHPQRRATGRGAWGAATALRGVPMLNSLLRGPVEQLAKSPRHVCQGVREGGPERRRDREPPGPMGRVAPRLRRGNGCRGAGRGQGGGGVRRFLIPERIDRVHPLLQPGFRAMEERFAQVSWERWSRRASPSAPPTSSPRGSTSSGVWGSAKCSAG